MACNLQEGAVNNGGLGYDEAREVVGNKNFCAFNFLWLVWLFQNALELLYPGNPRQVAKMIVIFYHT